MRRGFDAVLAPPALRGTVRKTLPVPQVRKMLLRAAARRSPISGGSRSSSRHRSRPAALGSSRSRSSRIPALLPRTGPGEEEEGGLSLPVPPQNHLERGEAPEQLTRNIQVCQGQVLAGRCFGFPGVWSSRSLVPPRGREGTFVMSTRTSPGDTPSPPCPPAVAAGRRQRATAARR